MTDSKNADELTQDPIFARIFEVRGSRTEMLELLSILTNTYWPAGSEILASKRERQLELFYDRFYEQFAQIMADEQAWLSNLAAELEAWSKLIATEAAQPPLLQPVTPEAFGEFFNGYWQDLSHDEALAQLLAALDSSLQPHPCEDVLLRHLELGAELYQRAPAQLFELGRSPLRAVLALLCGADLALPRSMPRVWRWLTTYAAQRPWLQRALGSYSRTPDQLLEHLALCGVPEVALPLAWHLRTPAAALEVLAKTAHAPVLQCIASHANAPLSVLEDLATHGSRYLQFLVARHPKLGVETQAALLRTTDFNIWQSTASNPNFSVDALKGLSWDTSEVFAHVAGNTRDRATQVRLLGHPSHGVQESLAVNPHITPDCLNCLASSEYDDVRALVAKNGVTPVPLLCALAKDANVDVREAVASNTASPPSLLQQLIEDGAIEVRAALGRNDATPSDVLLQLTLAPEARVRAASAQNDNCPESALLRLSQDPDADVRHLTALNLRTPLAGLHHLARDSDPRIRHAVSYLHRVPGALARALAQDPDETVRRGLAANSQVPPAVLERLVNDPDETVRACLAWNRSTPPRALAQLADDADDEVRTRLANNFSIPPSVSLRLANDPEVSVRRCLAHSRLGDDALELLAQDADAEVRKNIAERHSPARILDRLARDPSLKVREVAARNVYLFLESA